MKFSDEHALGGWSVTVGELKNLAKALLLKMPDQQARIKQFFLPALDNNAEFNFSELLLQFWKDDPQFLIDMIQLQDNGLPVFSDIRDFTDFALGSRHIDEKPPVLIPTKHSAHYILGEYYTVDPTFTVLEIRGRDDHDMVAYYPRRINLPSPAAKYAFVRLQVLQKTLKSVPMSILKEMLKQGIDEKTIVAHIHQNPHPKELRLQSLFPDVNNRPYILITIPTRDHNDNGQMTKTYLSNGHYDLHVTQVFHNKNLDIARTLYAHYNLRFKVVSKDEDVFHAISEVAHTSPNGKIACLLMQGHSLSRGQQTLGIVLGDYRQDPRGLLGLESNITKDAFSPLEGGLIVLNCCNSLDLNGRSGFVDFIASKTENTTVIAPTKELTADMARVNIEQDGKIDFKFSYRGNDLTYQQHSADRSKLELK